MIALLLAVAASCWPPALPAVTPAHMVTVVRTEYLRADEPTIGVTAVVTLYNVDGTFLSVARLQGVPALIDDHPGDGEALDWFIDPGMLTDDAPPKVQANPHPTCQWRRRGEKT